MSDRKKVIVVPDEYEANSFDFVRGYKTKEWGDTVIKVGDELKPYPYGPDDDLAGDRLKAWQAGYKAGPDPEPINNQTHAGLY